MPRMAPVVIPNVPHHVPLPANKAGGQAAATFARMSSSTRIAGAISCFFQKTLKLLRLRTRTGRPAEDATLPARLEELGGGSWLPA